MRKPEVVTNRYPPEVALDARLGAMEPAAERWIVGAQAP
jgi:hypothetical protein